MTRGGCPCSAQQAGTGLNSLHWLSETSLFSSAVWYQCHVLPSTGMGVWNVPAPASMGRSADFGCSWQKGRGSPTLETRTGMLWVLGAAGLGLQGARGMCLVLSPRDEGLCPGLYCPLVATANTAGEPGLQGWALPGHPVPAPEPGMRPEPISVPGWMGWVQPGQGGCTGGFGCCSRWEQTNQGAGMELLSAP